MPAEERSRGVRVCRTWFGRKGERGLCHRVQLTIELLPGLGDDGVAVPHHHSREGRLVPVDHLVKIGNSRYDQGQAASLTCVEDGARPALYDYGTRLAVVVKELLPRHAVDGMGAPRFTTGSVLYQAARDGAVPQLQRAVHPIDQSVEPMVVRPYRHHDVVRITLGIHRTAPMLTASG